MAIPPGCSCRRQVARMCTAAAGSPRGYYPFAADFTGCRAQGGRSKPQSADCNVAGTAGLTLETSPGALRDASAWSRLEILMHRTADGAEFIIGRAFARPCARVGRSENEAAGIHRRSVCVV